MEVVEKSVEEWKPVVHPLLRSKVDEFKILGYSHANEQDVWKCLVEKVWKGNPNKRLFEITQDVLHLSAHIYMSYITVSAYQNTDEDLMASISALSGNRNEE